MKLPPSTTIEPSASKHNDPAIEKTPKKPSQNKSKVEFEKNQILYQHKLHQKHHHAIHAIFASTIFCFSATLFHAACRQVFSKK
jgi:hypothetical protein